MFYTYFGTLNHKNRFVEKTAELNPDPTGFGTPTLYFTAGGLSLYMYVYICINDNPHSGEIESGGTQPRRGWVQFRVLLHKPVFMI